MASPEDELAVSKLYDKLMDGWNRGSGADFASAMTQDVAFIGFDGTWFKTRTALAAFQEELFRTHLKGTRLVGEVVSIKFVAAEVALVHARGNTIMRGQSKPNPARESIQTLVAVRSAGAWELAAFQNTRVRPMGSNVVTAVLWLVGDLLWGMALRLSGSLPQRS